MTRDPDRIVAWTLRAGAYGSFFLITIGLVATAAEVGVGARLTWTGMLLLLATPLLRIVAALVVFAQGREWWYVWISLGVLAILLASAVIGAIH